jgi:hypothetical protein
MLLFAEIVIELTNTVHMTVDRLGLEPLSHQMINVLRNFRVHHTFYRHIQPNDKSLDGAQVVFNRVGRAVPSLQVASPVHEAVGHHCGYPPFLSWTWP